MQIGRHFALFCGTLRPLMEYKKVEKIRNGC